MTPARETDALLEHLFRRQSGRMVAHLARLLGPARLDLAEECVQESMIRALQAWPYRGVPENPEGWLFRVARNAAIDAVRRDHLIDEKSEEVAVELARAAPSVETEADELRLIVLCCHPEIPREASVALSLKIAGGFGVSEIARAFLADETAIAQRLVRAKRQIRDRGLTLEMPSDDALRGRLDAVLETIYFIFNEGYAAHDGDALIRHDLCREALRLGRLIASSSLADPRVHALVAMMAFHSARSSARVDDAGDLILFDDQDRGRWDRQLIDLGFHHFELCMSGETVSEYHVQAAIGATHARAGVDGFTDWPIILELYDQLMTINPSPVVALNRGVAVAKVHGAAAALAAIEPSAADPKLQDYYLALALRGHLLLELGRNAEAAVCFRRALECRCSEPERRFLRRKLAQC